MGSAHYRPGAGAAGLSWLPIAYAETSLLWLIAGVIALDFAVQAVHVSNQSLIIAARPAAASRLVGAYMCFYSLGSAAGAIVATQLYSHWGWQAVCLAGAAVSACAFLSGQDRVNHEFVLVLKGPVKKTVKVT
jgi:MFS family permease